MYFKMSLNNVKKSIKDYFMYFLTLTLAVSVFYSFNSINNQTIMAEMNSAQKEYVTMMNEFISILSIGVSVILGALIIYATNFIVKRRKKEFGIYMTLGMKKRSMAVILFLETLYIGIISLIAGLLLGLLLSQVLSIFTAKLFSVEMTKYSFVVSFEAILKTILYFGLMFIIVMIFNVFVISKYKLIDLLCANRKNEKIKIKNIYISSIILSVSFVILGFAYSFIIKSNLDVFGPEFRNSIILGIIGTVLFFYGFSSVIVCFLRRIPDIYFNKLNCFNIRQMLSKFNTNFISMSVICLMLLVTIGTLSCGITVKNGMEQTLEEATPFDATILSEKDGNEDEEIEYISIRDIFDDMGYDVGDNGEIIEYKVYTKKDLNMQERLKDYADDSICNMIDVTGSKGTDMMPISVFNNIMSKSGRKTLTLNDDEILVSSNYEPFKECINGYLKDVSSINIDGKEFKVKYPERITESTMTYPMLGNVFTLIVPDYLVDGLEISEEALNINFKPEYKKTGEKELTEVFSNYDSDEFEEKYKYFVKGLTRKMCYDANRGISTLVLFLSVYIGIIFLVTSAAVLALQQLSSCNESIERYRSLKKIGVGKRMINKSIFAQVFMFFMMPLSLALIHSFVGIKVVNSYLNALGSGNQFYSILFTALIMIIVYGGYLYSAYISYRNVVNSEINN